jgi:transcriptional regulator with XRE-family HTH domain
MTASQIELWEVYVTDQKTFFKELGRRLAVTRKEHGLTQVQMAEQSACSQQLIAAYEAGRLNIPIWRLLNIAEALGVQVDDLLKGTDNGGPGKRGPASKLDRLTDQITKLPRSRQRFVVEMIEDAVARAQ